jgi:hypothetical protein
VDETAAIWFVRNTVVEFAERDAFYPHTVGDAILWDKLGNSWGLLSELVTQAAGPPGNIKFSHDETTCMATCYGLTDQVVQAVMPYHAKLVHKSAKEALAVELLNRDDLRAWLRATQDIKD